MACVLQTSSGDIDITGGKLTVVTDPVAAGAIKLRNRFNLFLGEWYADTRVGVPWFQRIMVKNPNLRLIETIVRSIITSTSPFVSADVTVSPPDAKRKSTITFVATVDPLVAAGATVTATSLDAPFIVNIPSKV